MDQTAFRVKRSTFFGRKVAVLCQNENGPCPLLAIGNALLLQGRISIHEDMRHCAAETLAQIIADEVLAAAPSGENGRLQADEVIGLLPRLLHGMDVNVRYRNVQDFEFTAEMQIFDVLGLELLHGWLPDAATPEEAAAASLVQTLSYNQIMERMIEYQGALESGGPAQAPVDVGAPGQHVLIQQKDGEEKAAEAPAPAETARTLAEPVAQPVGDGGADARAVKAVEQADNADVIDAANVSAGAGAEESASSGPDSPADAAEDAATASRTREALASAEQLATTEGSGEDTAVPETAASDTWEMVGDADSQPGSPTPAPPLDATPDTGATAAAAAPPSLEPVEAPLLAPMPPTPSAEDQAAQLEVLREGSLLMAFFHSSATQLTYAGLQELHQHLRPKQVAVFFRNNHFSTIFRPGPDDAGAESLFLLVSDLGYADVPEIVWESLDSVDGDTVYHAADLRRTPLKLFEQDTPMDADLMLAMQMSASEAEAPSADPDADLLLALQLSQDTADQGGVPPVQQGTGVAPAASASWQGEDDLAMARRLQEEENRHEEQIRAQAAARAQAVPVTAERQPRQRPKKEKKKEGECVTT